MINMKNPFKKQQKINFGPYGSISVWHGSSEMSGHFWGDIDKVTDKMLTKLIIKELDRYRIEFNMSNDDYNHQLMRNIRNNNLEKYYNSIQLKK